MGQFLSMSGVLNADENSVVDALQSYVKDRNGRMEKMPRAIDDDDCLSIAKGMNGTTVLYPGAFIEWDEASQYLSAKLQCPVFSFHIHDGDLWMYVLFERDDIVDQFNPLPEYWQEVSQEERADWVGDATEIARVVPGLLPEQISNYLVPWSDEILLGKERRKAYAADEFFYGDDWQLTDFMRKLGLIFPVDDSGSLEGVTFSFELPDR